ncbi:MAG: protein-tyrosine phosphatase family protein [Endozoicomonas sp.]|uniref:protein-tyrosine phosphatase family protein n=1 Tax=Endozoicomonas sp. TaxID=1892382 RepID=UPI003D9AD09B
MDLINTVDRTSDKGRGRFNWASIPDKGVVTFGEYGIEKQSEEIVPFHNLLPERNSRGKKVSAVVRVFKLTGPEGEREVRQVSFPDWPDMKPLPFEVLNELLNLVKTQKACCPGQRLSVNCLAGLGRTGTFLGVEEVSRQVEINELTTENLEFQVIQILMQGKLSCQHTDFVQTSGQNRCFQEAARRYVTLSQQSVESCPSETDRQGKDH